MAAQAELPCPLLQLKEKTLFLVLQQRLAVVLEEEKLTILVLEVLVVLAGHRELTVLRQQVQVQRSREMQAAHQPQALLQVMEQVAEEVRAVGNNGSGTNGGNGGVG